jgi:hypothetical protein
MTQQSTTKEKKISGKGFGAVMIYKTLRNLECPDHQ